MCINAPTKQNTFYNSNLGKEIWEKKKNTYMYQENKHGPVKWGKNASNEMFLSSKISFPWLSFLF